MLVGCALATDEIDEISWVTCVDAYSCCISSAMAYQPMGVLPFGDGALDGDGGEKGCVACGGTPPSLGAQKRQGRLKSLLLV